MYETYGITEQLHPWIKIIIKAFSFKIKQNKMNFNIK